MAFKDMIGHNFQKDCARESVKTSLYSEDSNWSNVIFKSVFALEIFEKNANIWFSTSVFLAIF